MTFTATYDGRTLTPTEPITLPIGTPVQVTVTDPPPSNTLLDMLAAFEKMPVNENWPADGAAQHDHYLYGTPKRP